MAGNNPTAARRSSYAEKLKDPRWQKKRLEVLQRDGWACTLCDAEDKTLHVHHILYLPKKDPWEYSMCFLQTLCVDCHDYVSGPDGFDYQLDAEGLLELVLQTGDGPDELARWANAIQSAWLSTQEPRLRALLDISSGEATAAVQRALCDETFVRYMVERYRADRPVEKAANA